MITMNSTKKMNDTKAAVLAQKILNAGLVPDRMKPSVVGGIGITNVCGDKESYVEISDKGEIHVVFSQGEEEPLIEKFEEEEIPNLVKQIYNYLGERDGI